MGLFSKSDRIAITFIAALICIGWGITFVLHRSEEPDNLRIIKNAVPPPEAFNAKDSLTAEFPGAFSPVNINKAGAVELEILPMIGPVKALAIVEYREKNGLFTDISDIIKVRGIGPATFEEIRKYITVDSDTLLTE